MVRVLPWIGYAKGAGIRTIGKSGRIAGHVLSWFYSFAFRLSWPWAVEFKFKKKIQTVPLF